MRGFPWRFALVTFVGGFLALVALLPDPATQEISTWSTAELLAALDTKEAPLRRVLVRQLVARSRTVIPTLEEAALQVDRAHLSGILEVLEELMLAADTETSEAAESALERMSAGPEGPVADGAMQILFSNSTLRHARAIGQYLERGGNFARSKTSRDAQATLPRSSPPNPFSPRILLLDDRWIGGDEGLRYVARVFPGETIIVHIGDESGVTPSGIDWLKHIRRNLFIRREGEACLGIIVNSYEMSRGILIADVIAKSPAADAGLKRGDIVVRFGPHRIRYLEELRELSAQHHPGQAVELFVLRSGARLRVKLFLGSDFGSQDCQCVFGATPAGTEPVIPAEPSPTINTRADPTSEQPIDALSVITP